MSNLDSEHQRRADNQTKPRSEIELQEWVSWTYPLEFWDKLSSTCLTHEALKELGRRNRLQQPAVIVHPPSTGDLAQFARQGGPDLSDLRGYRCYPTINHQSVVTGASLSLANQKSASRDPDAACPISTSTTSKTEKTTPYNRNFDVHLTDHSVHAEYSWHEPDVAEVQSALATARPSFSESSFSQDAFRSFQRSAARARDEADVLAHVIPSILGPDEPNHASARNTVFRNLAPLTDGTTAPAKPDIYYGAFPARLCRPVRDKIGRYIVPSTMLDKPLAPNFFLEVKGPASSTAVGKLQARYDGAVGARAIHSLQNYGADDQPVYDGQPYAYSAIYADGMLKLFAHHVTAPATDGGQSEYHMTQLRAFAMINSRETFVEGVTAFRNARDLAAERRDKFIEAANAKASQSTTPV